MGKIRKEWWFNHNLCVNPVVVVIDGHVVMKLISLIKDGLEFVNEIGWWAILKNSSLQIEEGCFRADERTA